MSPKVLAEAQAAAIQLLERTEVMGCELQQARAEIVELKADIRLKASALQAQDALSQASFQAKDAVILAKDAEIQRLQAELERLAAAVGGGSHAAATAAAAARAPVAPQHLGSWLFQSIRRYLDIVICSLWPGPCMLRHSGRPPAVRKMLVSLSSLLKSLIQQEFSV